MSIAKKAMLTLAAVFMTAGVSAASSGSSDNNFDERSKSPAPSPVCIYVIAGYFICFEG